MTADEESHGEQEGKENEWAPPGEAHVDRRSVLAFAFGAVSTGLLEEILSRPSADWLKGRIHETLRRPGTSLPATAFNRLNLAFELFLSSQATTEFIPPRAWDHAPPDIELGDGTKTYGHEYEVLRRIAALFSSAPIAWDVRSESWLAHTRCSQVLLASGQSNEASRVVLGRAENPRWSLKIGGRVLNMAYSIGVGAGRLKRHQYGEIIERKALAICNRNGKILVQAEGAGGWQQNDYLLVTRIPGPKPHTVVTLLAGLHGPGTRSAEMLFTEVSSRDLTDLAAQIDHESGSVPYFQAVFMASRLQTLGGSSVATRLELVTKGCPPVRLS